MPEHHLRICREAIMLEMKTIYNSQSAQKLGIFLDAYLGLQSTHDQGILITDHKQVASDSDASASVSDPLPQEFSANSHNMNQDRFIHRIRYGPSFNEPILSDSRLGQPLRFSERMRSIVQRLRLGPNRQKFK